MKISINGILEFKFFFYWNLKFFVFDPSNFKNGDFFQHILSIFQFGFFLFLNKKSPNLKQVLLHLFTGRDFGLFLIGSSYMANVALLCQLIGRLAQLVLQQLAALTIGGHRSFPLGFLNIFTKFT